MRARRLWIRFSVRTLFLAVTVFGIWFGCLVDRARRQREIVELVSARGGRAELLGTPTKVHEPLVCVSVG